ncbi:MAG TPA: Ig-like domain-containing protein, partial [Polyangiaceae bacterium]|nr:Ig-like domain-containing protein [Polyangiaceae bacterium]
QLTFDAPIDPESLGYLEVDLVEEGVSNVVGWLSVDGAVVTFEPIRPLVLDHAYTLEVAVLVKDSGWISLGGSAFRTRDGAWSAPAPIVDAGASAPELAIGEDGGALVLWQASTDRGARLHGAYLESSAGAWQTFAPTASGGPSAYPTNVVAGDDGLFVLTWVDGPATQGALYRAGDSDLLDRYSRLGPQRLRADATSALWAGGRALVATNYADTWLDVYHTEGNRFWPGAKSIALSDNGRRFAGPLLIGDGGLSARALWMQWAGAGGASMPLEVWGATLAYSGDWSEPEALATLDASGGIEGARAVGSASGVSLVAWENVDATSSEPGSRLGLLVLDADDGANASRPDAIDALGDARSPAVAVSAIGDALVTWVATDASADEADAASAAWAAYLPAGESEWSAAMPLSAADARARPPALAVETYGEGHALWVELDATGATRLMAAHFAPDAGFSSPRDIAASSPGAAPAAGSLSANGEGPRVAVDGQGRALAVWVSATGGLWSSRYE